MVSNNLKLQGRQPEIEDANVFDRHHFAQQTFHDSDLQVEILGLFRTQLTDVLGSLSQDVTPASWRFVFHTLKGAAAAVGANEIARLAGDLELKGMPDEKIEVDVQVNRLEKAINSFRAIAD